MYVNKNKTCSGGLLAIEFYVFQRVIFFTIAIDYSNRTIWRWAKSNRSICWNPVDGPYRNSKNTGALDSNESANYFIRNYNSTCKREVYSLFDFRAKSCNRTSNKRSMPCSSPRYRTHIQWPGSWFSELGQQFQGFSDGPISITMKYEAFKRSTVNVGRLEHFSNLLATENNLRAGICYTKLLFGQPVRIVENQIQSMAQATPMDEFVEALEELFSVFTAPVQTAQANEMIVLYKDRIRNALLSKLEESSIEEFSTEEQQSKLNWSPSISI